jgi:hypothetical protein
MQRESDKLQGYSGPNPFHESQGRAGIDRNIVAEFFPTSGFWSLFNNQHEILLGTRGSGKTFLLRMMSYTLLREFTHEEARKIVNSKSFIGFYVPLHLEFLAALAGKNCEDEEKLEYFQFAFNCAAAKALLSEVKSLLEDCYSEARPRLIAEEAIIAICTELWFGRQLNTVATVTDLQWELEKHYALTPFWKNGALAEPPPLARPILTPIASVLPRLSEKLGLDPAAVTWVATIDEAEFLSPAFIRCINTFLRSEKRPLVAKLATLPFKYSTCETLIPNICIEPNGNDFNYRVVDLPWDSDDFRALTNYICAFRLQKCGLPQNLTVESFLGTVGNDDLIDYFRAELGDDESSEPNLLRSIIESLSPTRRRNYERISAEPDKVDRPYLHRFAPVYFTRRMRIENSHGARTAAWFAGASTIRRIADGNPRRFIQLMNHLVDKARSQQLTPRNQHRIITAFCKRYSDDLEGYPDCGPLLKEIIETVGHLLSERVHGHYMIDSGCSFAIEERLLAIEGFRKTVEFAIGYSIIIADLETTEGRLTPNSDLRLSYIFAVTYWLPMRKGDPPTLRSTREILPQLEWEKLVRRDIPADGATFQLDLFEQRHEFAQPPKS